MAITILEVRYGKDWREGITDIEDIALEYWADDVQRRDLFISMMSLQRPLDDLDELCLATLSPYPDQRPPLDEWKEHYQM